MTRRDALLLGAVGVTLPAHGADVAISYPRHRSLPDPQQDYMLRLIKLALEHLQLSCHVEPGDVDMLQERTLAEMARGQGHVDLMWTMTNRSREAIGPLPVRIPLDKGLMGWRLLMVRADELPRWRERRRLDQIRDLTAGQGHDWPDTEILRANGLRVGTSSAYDGLFRMLARGRIDYFPRSILEIDHELRVHANEGFAVVPQLMLYYPATSYFFVKPQRRALAEQLRLGLEAAIADGSMDALFREQYGPLIARYRSHGRNALMLKNPSLSAQTPLLRKELWLAPGQG